MLLPAAAIILTFALGNRQLVTISFDAFHAEEPAFNVRAPLFVVLFVAVMSGILIGGIASFASQGRYRRAARQYQAEAERLRADTARLTLAANSDCNSRPGVSSGRNAA